MHDVTLIFPYHGRLACRCITVVGTHTQSYRPWWWDDDFTIFHFETQKYSWRQTLACEGGQLRRNEDATNILPPVLARDCQAKAILRQVLVVRWDFFKTSRPSSLHWGLLDSGMQCIISSFFEAPVTPINAFWWSGWNASRRLVVVVFSTSCHIKKETETRWELGLWQ